MSKDRLVGVVLCGGASRRMGADKGSLLKDGMPWARYVASKLTPFELPVVFSVNALQLKSYPEFLPLAELVPDAIILPVADALPLAGPLQGLLSVHRRFPSNDLLLLACDMLDIDAATIGKMIAAYREDTIAYREDPPAPREAVDSKGFDFYIYQGEEFEQPFCGIYTSFGLRAVYDQALKGELTDLSLRSLFKEGSTKRIPIDRGETFGNYNSL